jgi:hypothetical protein
MTAGSPKRRLAAGATVWRVVVRLAVNFFGMAAESQARRGDASGTGKPTFGAIWTERPPFEIRIPGCLADEERTTQR